MKGTTQWRESGSLNGVDIVEILSSESEKEDDNNNDPTQLNNRKRKRTSLPPNVKLAPVFTQMQRQSMKRHKSEPELPSLDILLESESFAAFSEQPSSNVTEEAAIPQGRISYYLRNFIFIVDVVLSKDWHLFETEELRLLKKFRQELSEEAQRIYIRLFQRKGPWFRAHSLDYKEIDDMAAALLELDVNGFCIGLKHVTNEDLTDELLDTLTASQLKTICRAAGGSYARSHSYPAPGKASPSRDDLKREIKAFAQHRNIQRTIDGRGMLAGLVEKELRTRGPSRITRRNSYERSPSQGSSQEEGSEEDFTFSQISPSQQSQQSQQQQQQTTRKEGGSNNTNNNKPMPYCVVKLTQDTVRLFRRVNRLFFLKEGVDMTLLLLVKMEHVKYPQYVCHSHTLITKNVEGKEKEKEKEKGKGKEKEKEEEEEEEREENNRRRSGGDESFLTPPASPTNGSFNWEAAFPMENSYQRNRSVFASREEMLAYESAAELQGVLEEYLEYGTKSPSHAAAASFDFGSIEDIVLRVGLWLAHNASMPSRDPLVMIKGGGGAGSDEGEVALPPLPPLIDGDDDGYDTQLSQQQTQQQHTQHSGGGKKGRRRPSWSSLDECGSGCATLLEEYHKMVVKYVNNKKGDEDGGKDEAWAVGDNSSSDTIKVKVEPSKKMKMMKMDCDDDMSHQGGGIVHSRGSGMMRGGEMIDEAGLEEVLGSSMFCLNDDCLGCVSRLKRNPNSMEGTDNGRRKRIEANHKLVTDRPFLSRFTDGWVFTRMIHHSILSFERRKRHADATTLLRLLLSSPYCPGRRGAWWTRLAINLEHLGRKNEALLVAERALEDPCVRSGDRLLLQKKVLTLCKPPRRWSKPTHFVMPRAPRVVTIEGELVVPGVAGRKSRFVGWDGESECSVEGLALAFYRRPKPEGYVDTSSSDGEDEEEEEENNKKKKGKRKGKGKEKEKEKEKRKGKRKNKKNDERSLWGWEGTHCESGIFKTLFGLLMWDVLFADVDGVFQTPFQNAPLDLTTDAFYTSRKEIIEEKLEEIRTRPMDELIEEAWLHDGEQCLGVSWQHNKDQLKTIASCIGGKVLAHVCKILAEDHDGWSSGVPDLLLWKAEEEIAKIVEVKGPRDRLSGTQQAWIDQLIAAGMEVDVLRVKEKKRSIPQALVSSNSEEQEEIEENSEKQQKGKKATATKGKKKKGNSQETAKKSEKGKSKNK